MPPLSSLLLYLQGVAALVVGLWYPICVFWYGTPLEGDSWLLVLLVDYIQSPACFSSVFFVLAWNNDPDQKLAVALAMFSLAIIAGIVVGASNLYDSYMGNIEVFGGRKVKHYIWVSIATALLNFTVLVIEEWRAAWEGSSEKETAPKRTWERRGAIAEQGGLGPRSHSDVDLGNIGQIHLHRAYAAYAYRQVYGSPSPEMSTPSGSDTDKESSE